MHGEGRKRRKGEDKPEAPLLARLAEAVAQGAGEGASPGVPARVTRPVAARQASPARGIPLVLDAELGARGREDHEGSDNPLYPLPLSVYTTYHESNDTHQELRPPTPTQGPEMQLRHLPSIPCSSNPHAAAYFFLKNSLNFFIPVTLTFFRSLTPRLSLVFLRFSSSSFLRRFSARSSSASSVRFRE